MKNAGWLQDSDFISAVGALPLVSVDLVVVNAMGQLLLGQRRNAPARGWWFTPGGRVRKNEAFASCMQRVAASELGVQADDLQGARLMGVWDHFYEDSAFSSEVSTHYVNLPHVLRLSVRWTWVLCRWISTVAGVGKARHLPLKQKMCIRMSGSTRSGWQSMG